MKRVLSAFLIFALIFSMSACTSKTQINCYICNVPCLEESKFCHNCGADLMGSDEGIKNESESMDYSEFGFENNYGMNEWIEIDDYDFSDPKNAFIIINKSSGYYVKLFENGYYTERYFGAYDKDPIYKGDSSIGDLFDTYPYNIINNYLIELQTTNFPTWEIRVSTESGVPIINYLEKRYSLDPIGLIPTYFIDWTREIECFEEDNGRVVLKYYIESSYLK